MVSAEPIYLAMPSGALQGLLDVFGRAETTGVWPIQLRHGVAHSLQKFNEASTVNDYRPITIYPLPYRIWSSFHSKNLLKFISQHAPTGVRGNRVGSSTVAIWWANQAMLESALYDEVPLAGSVLDLVKAFNTLPRERVFRAAVHLGADGSVLRAWLGFVTTNVRHFSVRNALSPGLQRLP